MKIVLCPACNEWSQLLEDEIVLNACDCPACGFSMTWRTDEDVDVETREIPVRQDLDDSDLQGFLDFLNSLML